MFKRSLLLGSELGQVRHKNGRKLTDQQMVSFSTPLQYQTTIQIAEIQILACYWIGMVIKMSVIRIHTLFEIRALLNGFFPGFCNKCFETKQRETTSN